MIQINKACKRRASTLLYSYFELKSKERSILLVVKNSVMLTEFKTRVIDLIKMGCITKTLNYHREKIPPKDIAYVTLVFNICKISARLLCIELVSLDFKEKEIKVRAVLGDIVQ